MKKLLATFGSILITYSVCSSVVSCGPQHSFEPVDEKKDINELLYYKDIEKLIGTDGLGSKKYSETLTWDEFYSNIKKTVTTYIANVLKVKNKLVEKLLILKCKNKEYYENIVYGCQLYFFIKLQKNSICRGNLLFDVHGQHTKLNNMSRLITFINKDSFIAKAIKKYNIGENTNPICQFVNGDNDYLGIVNQINSFLTLNNIFFNIDSVKKII